MSDEYKDRWPDMRMKHLELIQNVVSRMANNSSSLKNYCMTLVAAMIGLSAAVRESDILLYLLPIILVFALLDANYLRLERSFRAQYDSVRKGALDTEPDFLITTGWGANHKWYQSLWSWSVFWFYSSLVIAIFMVRWVM